MLRKTSVAVTPVVSDTALCVASVLQDAGQFQSTSESAADGALASWGARFDVHQKRNKAARELLARGCQLRVFESPN